MFKFLRTSGLLLLPFMLTGCVSLSTIGTMQTMSKLDVVNDPIEKMVFAVEADQNLKPVPEKTRFVFSLTPEGGQTQKTYVGLRLAEPGEVPGASKLPAAGQNLHVFVFPDAEQEKLRAIQGQVRTYKAQNIKGSLAMGVEPEFCKTTKQIAPNSKFSVYVARTRHENLMPLLAGMKVRELEEKGGPDFLLPCK
ncbi:hypothetical protein [Maritalea mediterranea]|uniref:Lipoprotein n=1 Tax=Maritalea mediterranea TaxID=2909667 RepID=A0ABS9E3K6_9HYPH|nr:hypothetical protein [Maritalea mediterranea]MCF4097445.1 hypothetical protein [Maritalea mediterranea]